MLEMFSFVSYFGCKITLFRVNDKKSLCFLAFSFADLLKIPNFAVVFCGNMQNCCPMRM